MLHNLKLLECFVGIIPKLTYDLIKEIFSRFYRFCSDIGRRFLDFILDISGQMEERKIEDMPKLDETIRAFLKAIEEVDGNDK